MLSLTKTCQFPLVTLVTMRGEWGEFNTWQIPMGRTTEAHLELSGVACYRCDTPNSVGDTVRTGIRYAYHTHYAVAVLLGQRLLGTTVFEAGPPEGPRCANFTAARSAQARSEEGSVWKQSITA